MRDWKAQKIEKMREENSKVIKHFVYFVVSVAVIILIVVFLHPFRFFSPRFITKGDEFLLQRKYTDANLQYEKALMIDPKSVKAKSRIELAEKGQKDILALTDFFKEKNAQDELDKIQLATSVPQTETEALKISKKFVDEGDFQLALLPAQTALQMDPDYKEAREYVQIIQKQISK